LKSTAIAHRSPDLTADVDFSECLMLAINPIAFKEWSAICAALAEGAQTLIIRKGGIHEGRDGFRVAHREFWLFPTQVHAAQQGLVPHGRRFLDQVAATQVSPGFVPISLYAVVEDVYQVESEGSLAALSGKHFWSPETIEQRFHYRTPGVFVLVARMFRAPLVLIPEGPDYAGCRSWVTMHEPLSTAGLVPVLDDRQFAEQRHSIRHLLQTV
jgi:hypothetical protein